MSKEMSIKYEAGVYIRKTRRCKSISGAELGRLLNVSQQQISRYENGVSNISLDMMSDILVALDKTWIDFIFSFSPENVHAFKLVKDL